MNKSQKTHIRHTTIFHRLNAGETVNIKTLAEEFGVSERTVQIDLNKRLAQMYEIVDLGHGNYAFAEGYRLKGSENEEERIAISLMKSLQQSAIPDMTGYIDAALPSVRHYEAMFLFDLDLEPIGDIGTFRVILQAIQWRTGLEFDYTKTDGSTRQVTVHPYRIANFKNYWYLIAYDLADEKIKSYYLKKIDKLHALYENFIADEATEAELDRLCSGIDSAWYNGTERQATLRARGDARFYLERHLPSHLRILERHDDCTTLQMGYTNDTEVLSLVKKWLPDIEIVEPTTLAQTLEATLRSYLERRD